MKGVNGGLGLAVNGELGAHACGCVVNVILEPMQEGTSGRIMGTPGSVVKFGIKGFF